MELCAFVFVAQLILGIQSITVPPVWPKRDVKPTYSSSYGIASYLTTGLPPVNSEFRPSNHQKLLIYHPEFSGSNKEDVDKPQSYQIMEFDNQNPDVVVKSKPKQRQVHDEYRPRGKLKSSASESEEYKAPRSEHEFSREVPTKPVYPGEGYWARFGLKHRPYSRPPIMKMRTVLEPPNKNPPEGYETFEEGAKQFQNARLNFRHNVDSFPQRHHFIKMTRLNPMMVTDSEPLYQSPPIGFIPDRLYTQVRRTETEEQLPQSEAEDEEDDEESAGRLREIIKDSKIHTVYTEEGYEDSAYDHAGHEKNAENSEGQSRSLEDESKETEKAKGSRRNSYANEGGKIRGNNSFRRKSNKNQIKNNEESNGFETYQNEDSDISSSNNRFRTAKPDKTLSKDIKKISLKNGDKGDIDMEILTEVKYTSGPEQIKHKFVKIVPIINEKDENETVKKRVKRYNKEVLSKRYVRKRPSYYWKKKITSQTNAAQKLKLENTSQLKEKKPTTIQPETYQEIPQQLETTTRSYQPLVSPTTKTRKFLKRQKRYTIDHPNLNIDLSEFINVDTLPNPTPKPDLTFQKFPYYNLPINKVNENSPIRYAEDLRSIPKKEENEMSFYESRSHINCPEIESDIDPTPKRKLEESNEETTKKVETPRLGSLGDKIDCLKVKYFGENPLDSPFFQETTINEPVPFFSLKTSYFPKRQNIGRSKIGDKTVDNEQKTKGDKNIEIHSDIEKLSPQTFNYQKSVKQSHRKIKTPVLISNDELFEAVTMNPIHEKNDAVLKPPYTLTEMMNRNRLQPKNIYEQLSLLDPQKEEPEKSLGSAEPFIIIYNNQDVVNEIQKEPSEPLTFSTNNAQPIQRRLSTVSYVIDKIGNNVSKNPNYNFTTSEIQYKENIKPIEQMQMYTGVLKTINEAKESEKRRMKLKSLEMKPQILTPMKEKELTKFKVIVKKKINDPRTNQIQGSSNVEESAKNIIGLKPPVNRIQNYYVIGMKPPKKLPRLKYHLISKRDTQQKNNKAHQIKQTLDTDDLLMEESRHIDYYVSVHNLAKREAPPPRKSVTYTDIVRPKSVKNESEEDTEEGLNPRKRIYDFNSAESTTTTEASFEYDQIISEEKVEHSEDVPSTSVIYPVEAHSEDSNIAEYIFLVDKLHDKYEKEAPSTTTTSTTSNPQNVTETSGEPEFLQIINNLHDLREQEEEQIITTETSVTEPIPVRNSNPLYQNSQRFEEKQSNQNPEQFEENLSDSKRVFNAKFQTSIDTSKYKTIERSPVTVRYNLSSRYNSDDQELPLNRSETTQLPMILSYMHSDDDEIADQVIELTTTSRPRQPIRRRLIPKMESVLKRDEAVTNPLFRRRRPIRVTTTPRTKPELYQNRFKIRMKPELPFETRTHKSLYKSTTEKPDDDINVNSSNTNNLDRSQKPQNRNHKPTFTSVPETSQYETEATSTPDNDETVNKSQNSKTHSNHKSSYIPVEENLESEIGSDDNSQKMQERRALLQDPVEHMPRKLQYEVVGPLTHVAEGHGGNYKYENNEDIYLEEPPNADETTTRSRASNSLSNDEITGSATRKAKSTHSKLSLYPNMARMINRLAYQDVITPANYDQYSETDNQSRSPDPQQKVPFIKDPSRRMYYYVNL